MSITQESIRALIGEYSRLGRTGSCSAAGSATTLVDARGLASYAIDIPEGSVVVLKFTKTATTISFDNASSEIRDSGNGLAAYRVGDTVKVSGSTDNDGQYTITTIDSGGADITVSETLTDEAAGDTVTLTTHEQSWVTDFAKATGTVTFSPGGNTSAVAQTYEIWEPVVENIGEVNDAANRALTQRCYSWILAPVTILLDGDMEKSTYADWTAGASATLSKLTTLTPKELPYRQFLYVYNASGNGYAYQTFGVDADEKFSVAVLYRANLTTDTAQLVVYDVTNSATITLDGADDGVAEAGQAWQVMRSTFTVPAGCLLIQVRLGVSAAAESALFLWAALSRQSRREVMLPDRITQAQQVGRVFKAHRKVQDPYEIPGSWRLEELMGAEVVPMTQGKVLLRFPWPMGDGLYLYEEQSLYTALTADDATDATGTTNCPDDYVAYVGAYELVSSIARRQKMNLASQSGGPEVAAAYQALADEFKERANVVASQYARPPSVVVRGRPVL